jgi:putative transposase
MNQVLKVQISDPQSKLYKSLYKGCYNSARLYNFALYHARQEFFENGLIPTYPIINKWMLNAVDDKGDYPYRRLPSTIAQETIRYLGMALTSYRNSIEDYNKSPSKYTGMPKVPKYIKKDGLYPIYFVAGNSFSTKLSSERKIVCFPASKVLEFKRIQFDLPSQLNSNIIKGIRIVPHHNVFDIEYVYEVYDTPLKPNNDRALAIDFGINNFITIVDNTGNTPFVIKGNVIKSINHHYNKSKSKAQSQLPKGIHTSTFITKLGLNRTNQLKDQFHKISSGIIDYCISNDINTVVIGYNKYWKQKVSMGSKVNQKFTSIPYYKFKQILKYKCELQGINISEVNEAYTSKCSFLDGESVEYHAVYLGERITRGQFKTSNGTILNADVNAAANILVKSGFTISKLPLLVHSYIPCSSKRNPKKTTRVVKFGYSYS